MSWVHIIVCVITIVGLLIPHTTEKNEDVYIVPEAVTEYVNNTVSKGSLLFVGDVMLGRNVEKIMSDQGVDHPFQNTKELVQSADVAVLNFEGVVPLTHIPTPSGVMRFSIKKTYLEHLQSVGFDVLSLANNHSSDYGLEALMYTRQLCTDLKLVCGGSSSEITEESVKIVQVGDISVGIIFLHTLFVSPDISKVKQYMKDLVGSTSVQIAYVHWGDEYALVHNTSQKSLAYALIDMGVDAVVGHHPHVIQDIEIYKNAPIFYSLGNFIFDQYFSVDVQEGLAVRLEIKDNQHTYTISGVSSLESRSQPSRMNNDRQTEILKRILGTYADDARVQVSEGIISIKHD